MKLVDLVQNINNIDEELVVFLEDKENSESNIILMPAESDDQTVNNFNGKKYYYLIEVFLAKDFLQDWTASLNHTPTPQETAKRLFDYGINDA